MPVLRQPACSGTALTRRKVGHFLIAYGCVPVHFYPVMFVPLVVAGFAHAGKVFVGILPGQPVVNIQAMVHMHAAMLRYGLILNISIVKNTHVY